MNPHPRQASMCLGKLPKSSMAHVRSAVSRDSPLSLPKLAREGTTPLGHKAEPVSICCDPFALALAGDTLLQRKRPAAAITATEAQQKEAAVLLQTFSGFSSSLGQKQDSGR